MTATPTEPSTSAAGKIVLLASSSPRRQELIRSLGVRYDIKASNADETTEPGLAPEQIVETLSLRKAAAVRDTLGDDARGADAVIVGSDTIVVLDGEVLGKPRDDDDAFRMLSKLQGRPHIVYSGVACLHAATGRSAVRDKATAAHMKPQDEARIRRCIATGEPLDKAVGYGNTMHLGDTGQYRILSESPSGNTEMIVGHTVNKVTFRPLSEDEIRAYIQTGEPLDKAGAYGVQGLGAIFIERIEGDFYSVMGLPLNLLYQMLLKFGINPLLSLKERT